ncbi:TPA: Lar family restriction alleviation protein [Klebsiella pneumoniae]|uniref:Lar family restriction alleviation protein n=1 Tax=Klebsiella pneumoniae TaxID=573 RepID=UPI000665C669|nr:Lar family restriction alleviation protein [Klebsiella pneumoniae]HBQ1742792.1 Lar family restriction alleviation protein [Klebsiella pneumoniae]HBQ1746361.1 Lar family restriction alleviation protein [Klebsiella pneumoniae]HBR3329534.1 Lar family restriction alleviation protein [Klebsiella pneumoniae]HBR3986231.1 Lar family restriction alleviation protein [Klebsiella pneumoniae]HBR5275346.1 Lar family restriction alleviation protein [Klebsiella pneumoniae]
MTKSTITRERIQRIIRAINSEAYDEEEIREWLSSDEIMELSLMALAAMDGEHKRNPVLAYADSYRDMAKQGVESVQIWSVITDLERNIAPLYRHPQPAPVAPVVSADLLHTAASAIEDLLTTKDRTGAGVWFDLPFRLRSAANAQPVPLVPDKNGLLPCPFCGGEPEEDAGGCSEFHGHEHQDYSITCKQCGAEVYCSVGTFEKADVPCSCHHDTRKVCVDKWNRRAAMLAAAPQEVK